MWVRQPTSMRRQSGRGAYPVGRSLTVNSDLVHGFDNGLCRFNKVSVYRHAIGHQFAVGETILVDNFHLFNDRRLAAFTRPGSCNANVSLDSAK